jgi:hypothetical protein
MFETTALESQMASKCLLKIVLGHEHIVERILGRSGHPRLSMYKCVSAKAFMP